MKIPTIVTRPQNGLCQHKAKDVKEDPIFSSFFTTRCMTRSPLETFDIGFNHETFTDCDFADSLKMVQN